jgi:bacteriocin-like protein
MKNQNLSNGKKLNKKQLRSITGGLLNCFESNCPTLGGCPILNEYGCITIATACAQKECRP